MTPDTTGEQALRKAISDVAGLTPELVDAVYDAVEDALDGLDYHGTLDCEECDVEHCDNPDEHGQSDALIEAVQMLHRLAHNGPTEPLDASRCTREPCVTVGGLVSSSDARSLFAPGSRVA